MTEYKEFIVRVRNADLIAGSPFDTPYLHGEIVRCRDCRWLDHQKLYLCMLPADDGEYACWIVEPDGFCAWASKRSEQ